MRCHCSMIYAACPLCCTQSLLLPILLGLSVFVHSDKVAESSQLFRFYCTYEWLYTEIVFDGIIPNFIYALDSLHLTEISRFCCWHCLSFRIQFSHPKVNVGIYIVLYILTFLLWICACWLGSLCWVIEVVSQLFLVYCISLSSWSPLLFTVVPN